jgi:BlaI family transcriptional regulator, penicillinase repressor
MPARKTPAPKERPYLTRAESELMRLLWTHGPSTVAELVQRLQRPVAYTTALTLIRILEQKGYAAHSPHPEGGRAHLYRAAVEPSAVRRRHVRDLIERLFGGDAEQLVAGLLDDESLTHADLKALRGKIDARLKNPRGRS